MRQPLSTCRRGSAVAPEGHRGWPRAQEHTATFVISRPPQGYASPPEITAVVLSNVSRKNDNSHLPMHPTKS